MFLYDFLIAFVVSAILSALLIGVFGWRRGTRIGPAILFAFAIIFFATWAGAAWIRQARPDVWGGYWLPFLLVGIFVMLFLAAVSPTERRPTPRERRRQGTEPAAGEAAPPDEPGAMAREAGSAEPAPPREGVPPPVTTGQAFFGVFFWALIAALVAAIVVTYWI